MNEFLNWNIHITDICKSLARNVGLLSKLKFVLPKNVLHTIYNSIVLPYFNYCNYVWGKKAVRIITKSHIRSPNAPL